MGGSPQVYWHWFQKFREREMTLKDRFLTQSLPDICHKMQKTSIWTKSVFKKLLQLAQMVYYRREYEEENKSQEKDWTPAWLLDPIWNSLRKNEKGRTCYYCGKEGCLKLDLSCPWLHVQSAEDHTGEETALWGVGPRGWTLKAIGTEGAWGSPQKLPS